ncbi:MAG TPA: cell division protein FtsQ/DivIB [Gaiellaceae bacterium]|nr:cell division protein FtsQ/DivIB [Gaiellaceae bacterium]
MARGRELAAARPQTRATSPALQLLPSGRSVAVGFGLLGAAFALYFGARESAVFAVRSIEVETEPPGHSRVVERALASIAGTTLLDVDEATITRRLQTLPHVHLLAYDRSFPNRLRIQVSVERPVAVLRRADENWLVSGEGRVLRKLQGRLRRPLPVVWIPRSVEPEVGTILRAGESARGVEALATIRAEVPSFFRRVWYVTSADHGLTVVLRDRFELRLGPSTEIAVKVEVARHVLVALRAENSSASYLDVSVPDRPVAGATLDSQLEP